MYGRGRRGEAPPEVGDACAAFMRGCGSDRRRVIGEEAPSAGRGQRFFGFTSFFRLTMQVEQARYPEFEGKLEGYTGRFVAKTKPVEQNDGSATFFKHSKFDLVDYEKVLYRDIAKEIEDVNSTITQYAGNSVALILKLQVKSDSSIVILGNTHLSTVDEESRIIQKSAYNCLADSDCSGKRFALENKEPQFTYRTNDALDYILFAEDLLKCTGALEPLKRQCRGQGTRHGVPSEQWGSDHTAVGACFIKK